jgi:hypothetical protein
MPRTVEQSLHVDNLTARLSPDSGRFFPELLVLDEVGLPAGGNVIFAIGLGMRCDGNATGYANVSAGWLECSARLARDPTAMSRDRRPLGVGFDYQFLTERTAVEPMQWRVELAVMDATGNRTDWFDSGWRDLDLTPVVTAPTVRLEVEDPCDWPDALEQETRTMHGLAALNVSFTSGFARANVSFDFGASHPGPQGTASPAAVVRQGQHSAMAEFPVHTGETAMSIRFLVSLETDAQPPSDDPGPCAAFAHEVQTWTVKVEYVTADGGVGGFPAVAVEADVYLTAAPSVL